MHHVIDMHCIFLRGQEQLLRDSAVLLDVIQCKILSYGAESNTVHCSTCPIHIHAVFAVYNAVHDRVQ